MTAVIEAGTWLLGRNITVNRSLWIAKIPGAVGFQLAAPMSKGSSIFRGLQALLEKEDR